jgi:hypothetical protein
VILTTDRVLNHGTLQRSGDVIELPPEEALRLIHANQAEAIEVIETAMDEPRSEIRITRRPKHGTSVK